LRVIVTPFHPNTPQLAYIHKQFSVFLLNFCLPFFRFPDFRIGKFGNWRQLQRCTSPLIAADAGGGSGNVPVYEFAVLVGTFGVLHKAAGQVPERKEGGIVQGE
jgi:hypothetical protein